MKNTVFIASDHAGYNLKSEIVNKYNEFIDLGTHDDESVDYPDYAKDLVLSIQKNNNSKGILICGSGLSLKLVPNSESLKWTLLEFASSILFSYSFRVL